MFYVAPFGERRMDLRMAVNTAHMMAMQSASKIEAAEFNQIIDGLSNYMPCDQSRENEVDLQAIKNMKGN